MTEFSEREDHKSVPVLMSPENPNGWTLEALSVQLMDEIHGKSQKIADDTSPAAVLVHQNNNHILNALRDIHLYQKESMEALADVGENQGPLGKPRIGKGS